MTRAMMRWAPVGAAIVIATTGLLIAGPLDPPAGPIASTPGPEPRIAINDVNTPGGANSVHQITESGSYYLEGNIVGGAGERGIEILANDVTIDLMGYELRGTAGSQDGIWGAIVASGVEVRNGTIRDWGGDGVLLGDFGVAQDLRVRNNDGTGIWGGSGALVVDCVAASNTIGIRVTNGSTVSRCTATFNDGAGILAADGCSVANCSAANNGGTGISVNAGSTITASGADGNGDGGLFGGVGAVIKGCAANDNTNHGIQVTNDGAVIDCTSRNNSDGITVFDGCIVRGNTCVNNTISGVKTSGVGGNCRFETNHCLDNGNGVAIFTTGNVIMGNTCSGNTTNWNIVEGNSYGPIVAAPAGAAVNGDTASGAINSNHPWANFTLP